MSEKPSLSARHRALRHIGVPKHKYAVGAQVFHSPSARSEKITFRVTRHLPANGEGLQYRIKGDRDGVERVVIESAIESAR